MNGSYEFSPLPLSNFLDRKFVFPRFQRRSVWNKKQNFELLLSLFKGYPLGVVIVSSEEIGDSKHNFLLDGRQRRTCLQQVKRNPEVVYEWAKNYCKLKSTDSDDEVGEKFWRKVDEFFFQEKDENGVDIAEEEIDWVYGEDDEAIEKSDLGGLPGLLKVIQGIHPLKPKESGLTAPFKLGVDVKNAPARISEEEEKSNKIQRILSGSKCSDLYRSLSQWLNNQELELNQKNVLAWLLEQNMFGNTIKMQQDLERKWDRFSSAFEVVKAMDDLFAKSSIGLVEAKNYSDTDRQMIFKFINDGGTPLNSVQILSASPYWNKRVSDAGKLQKHREDLYGLMDLPLPKEPVRWDCAACSPSILEIGGILRVPDLLEGNLDVRLKTGFKLYALHRSNSLNKQSIQDLGTDDSYWKTPLKMIERYQGVLRRLNKSEYFKFMLSWEGSVDQITSQNASMFYLEAVTKQYEHFGSPESGKKYYQWLNDAFALLDRLVLEVVELKWKGSSDALLARKLRDWQNIDWSLLDDERWTSVVHEVVSYGTVNGNEVDLKLSEKITRHMAFVSKQMGDGKGEIDHIIPKSKVVSSQGLELVNTPVNLALITPDLNREKRDKYPSELQDFNLEEFSKQAAIKKEKITDLKDSDSITQLRELRADYFSSFILARAWHHKSQDH